jgi:hypothetical protein
LVNESGATKVDTENKMGVVDEIASATPKSYSGYTFNPTYLSAVSSGIVAGDGSLVLRLYYVLEEKLPDDNGNGDKTTDDGKTSSKDEEVTDDKVTDDNEVPSEDKVSNDNNTSQVEGAKSEASVEKAADSTLKPKTGDNNKLLVYLVLGVMSARIVTVAFTRKHKKRK